MAFILKRDQDGKVWELTLNDPWLSSATADSTYLRLDCTNDPLTGTLTTQNIYNDADGTRQIGTSPTNIFVRHHSLYWNAILDTGANPITQVNTNLTGHYAVTAFAGSAAAAAVTQFDPGTGTKRNFTVGPLVNNGGGGFPTYGIVRLKNTGAGSIMFGYTNGYARGSCISESTAPYTFTVAWPSGPFNGSPLPYNRIYNNGVGSVVFSRNNARTGGIANVGTLSTAYGAFVQGLVNPQSSQTATIRAEQRGAFTRGYISTGGGSIIGRGRASFISAGCGGGGKVYAGTGASDNGAVALGFANNLGTINSSTDASFACGYITGASSYLRATGKASFAQGGNASGTTAVNLQASGKGAFAQGYIDTTSSVILSSGGGSFAQGYISAGTISSTGLGSFAQGNVGNSGTILTATGNGAMAQGQVTGSGSSMTAAGAGSLAHGRAIAGGTIATASTNAGSTVLGNAGSSGTLDTGIAANLGMFVAGTCTGATNYIRASGAGAWAGGNSTGDLLSSGSGSLAFGNCGDVLQATGGGSVAIGQASNGTLQATQTGAIAMGGTYGGNNMTSSGFASVALGYTVSGPITASGNGSLAIGYATAVGGITATATNSFQFGNGNNGVADSLAVGLAAGAGGIRLKGTAGAPGVPVAGDMWVTAGGAVTVQGSLGPVVIAP